MGIKEETLQYLGYTGQTLSGKDHESIDAAITEVQKIAEPRTVHRVFSLESKQGQLSVQADLSLQSSDLQKLLKNRHSVLILAATLGLEVDRRLRYYAKTDTSHMVIMDAAASALVEQVCDELQDRLPFQNYSFRFSPGYGDVPLDLQKQIVRVLETQKRIGMTLTKSLMMLPQKSITGIVGIGGIGEKESQQSCQGCRLFEDCEYRKRGTVCYKTESQPKG